MFCHIYLHMLGGIFLSYLFPLHIVDALCMGGGGHYAFYLDQDLYLGSSGQCDTFASPCLASASEFHAMHMEVWCFDE